MMAFISVLSMLNEHFYHRAIFEGIEAEIYMVADVSGTQAAANSLMGALNMLSFTIPPRAVHSYINNWIDHKIRGGKMDSALYMSDHNFRTLSVLKQK
jgi:hypothetical protein